MKYIKKVFQSKPCLFTFALSLILSYFLIPKKVFYESFILIAFSFMFLFALIITCTVKNFKEKMKLAKATKGSGLAAVATALGLISLQVCGVGAPVCGATVGVGLISIFLPATALGFVEKYAIEIILMTILLQLVSLKYMNCFKEVK